MRLSSVAAISGHTACALIFALVVLGQRASAQPTSKPLAGLSKATSHVSVSVKARPEGYWTNTGVQISAGDHVTVQYASGSWVSNPYWRTPDAAGNSALIAGSSYLRPGAPEGALIGKVGGNNSDGGSETFLIGNLASVPPGLTGTLWLTVNDEKKGFGDNKGEITVKISAN